MPYKDPEKKKQFNKEYREKNREKLLADGAEWREANKDWIKEYHARDDVKEKKAESFKKYLENNQEERNEYLKQYRLDNRDKLQEYENNRIKTDPNFKLRKRLRNRLYYALKNYQKVGSAIEDLGCSVDELKVHLEKQFKPGMTWDNWGKGKNSWNIDHIKALSNFNLEDREQFLEACHYTNLQPMWEFDNLSKGRKH